jgi:hypothetical protein
MAMLNIYIYIHIYMYYICMYIYIHIYIFIHVFVCVCKWGFCAHSIDIHSISINSIMFYVNIFMWVTYWHKYIKICIQKLNNLNKHHPLTDMELIGAPHRKNSTQIYIYIYIRIYIYIYVYTRNLYEYSHTYICITN